VDPVGAVFGYAIGTFQILALDWVRKRRQHRTQLRLLRSELRRLAEFQTPFSWSKVTGPPDDQLPRPPEPTPNFLKLIGEIDFYLTDEHHDDNTQVGLINVLDACQVLAFYHRKIEELLTEIRGSKGSAPRSVWDRAVDYADSYDKELARLHSIVTSAITDCERRLTVIGLWYQATRRPLGDLPPGENPPSLGPNDPRITPLPPRR
jgi:hypothetical protein